MSDVAFLDFDVVRKCMLRGAISLDLDQIVTASPVGRCIVLAKALVAAGKASPEMQALMDRQGVMAALKAETLSRQSGQKVCPPALTQSDKTNASKERYVG